MRAIIMFILLLSISACSTKPVFISAKDIPWNDALFQEEIPTQLISETDIFKLDEDLEARLSNPELRNLTLQKRITYFLDLVYSKGVSPFGYSPYDTTTAAKTWRAKKGNCISLTVLAYAIGKKLDLPIVMQDVDVPVQFDRRGNVEFLSTHVNALVLHKDFWFEKEIDERGYLIVDFEPQMLVLKRGRELTEKQIISHFYNNLGAEFYAKKKYKLAYAYYKQAIISSPNHFAAYNNLAQLYIQAGDQNQAEALLRFGLQINDKDPVVLRSLQNIFLSQQRNEEAEKLDKIIQASNDENPHYWIGLGMYAMDQKDFRKAISSFEKAQKLATGFAEIHQNLATAYFQVGNQERAKEEMKKFINILPEHPKSALYRSKITAR
ncbi:tetratricopeptide repeat protein [Undibacterium sp.]|uniref:tetratricopeptide repeat protein n=1 Tax=Undibacterium sp. TaxID=1914977 RepID=UPI0037515951